MLVAEEGIVLMLFSFPRRINTERVVSNVAIDTTANQKRLKAKRKALHSRMEETSATLGYGNTFNPFVAKEIAGFLTEVKVIITLIIITRPCKESHKSASCEI